MSLPALYSPQLSAVPRSEDEREALWEAGLRAEAAARMHDARQRLAMQADVLTMRRAEIERAALAGEDLATVAARFGLPIRLVRDAALQALTARPDPDERDPSVVERLAPEPVRWAHA